ncbi:MAG: ECF transporter S component [Ruminococcus sp.]|nr:ECF transporter S component [Ruminococcus sp.]
MNMAKNKNEKILFLVLTGLFTAMITVSTMIIRIPTPTKGYINLGDCFVNIAGWLLGGVYGGIAAGTGSALSDLFGGYTVYVLPTFIIKGLMAVAAFALYKVLSKKVPNLVGRIVSAIAAEIVMIVGYAVFEAFLFGSVTTALTGVPGNIVQGIGGASFGVLLYEGVIARIPAAKGLAAARK